MVQNLSMPPNAAQRWIFTACLQHLSRKANKVSPNRLKALTTVLHEIHGDATGSVRDLWTFVHSKVWLGSIAFSNSGSNHDHPTSTALKNLFTIARGCGCVGSWVASLPRVNGSPFASRNSHCDHCVTMLESLGFVSPTFLRWTRLDSATTQGSDWRSHELHCVRRQGSSGHNLGFGYHAMIIQKHLKVGHGWSPSPC